MKKNFLLLLLLFALSAGNELFAQNIGINSTGASPDPSAMLDISSTNAGLLVPRVTLSGLNDASTIASPATSLLIYNTGGTLAAGYYYNSGTTSAPVWTPFATGGNYWSSLDGTNIYNTAGGAVNIGNSTALSNGIQNIYSDGTTGYYGVTYYQTPATGTGLGSGLAIGQNDLSSGTALVWNFANAPIYFGTNGAPAAIITGNGNVGIGSFAPVAKTEISAFGDANNIYTIASGFNLITGLASYESDSVTNTEKAGVYSFVDGSSLESEALFGEAGSTAGANIGVLGRVSFAPTNNSATSGAIWGYDAVNSPLTYAGIFNGKVYTNGNMSTFGSSGAITPTASVIGWDAASYSSNANSGDDTVSVAGVLGYGEGGGSAFNAGVVGIGGSTASYNTGLIGVALDGPNTTNIGVFAEADQNAGDYAGYFAGNVFVSGTLNALGTKNFIMDHPLDPANKILRHAAVESNEVLDQYSGNITTDNKGYATVVLPDYFQSITKDFRYQLTVIGTFAQAIVKEKISANKFIVQTNQPNVEVSWQVTGVRNDKEMLAHPFVSEEEKTGKQAGKYFAPELYGMPASKGIIYIPKASSGKVTAIASKRNLKPAGSALSQNKVSKPAEHSKTLSVQHAEGVIGNTPKAKANNSGTVAPAQKK